MNMEKHTLSELKSAIVRNPLVVTPQSTVMEAIAQMSSVRSQCTANKTATSQLDEMAIEVRSSCVLVMENEKAIGIMTERDVVRLSAEQQALDRLEIREVMTSPAIALKDSAFTDFFAAITLLQQQKIRHLTIVDDRDCLVGIVTHESLRQTSRPIDLMRLRIVSEVMTHDVVCATPDDSMLAIAKLMATHHISSVMIVKVSDHSRESLQIPLGMLTERDIVQFQALGLDLQSWKAEAMMSSPVFAVKSEDSLWLVHQIMEQHFIRRLAVTGQQGELLGLVTQTSLLQALNPIALYNLADDLEKKVLRLEAEKFALLENRNVELEKQVEARTIALKVKAEREKLVSKMALQIRSSLSLQTILNEAVTQVRQLLACDRVNIWQFESDWQASVVAESTDSEFSLVGARVNDTCFKQAMSEIYRQGKIRVVSDIYETEMADCHREMLIRIHTRAKVIVPIICDDQLWGVMNISESQHPRIWDAEEIDLLQDIAVQVAIAIQQATTHQQLLEELIERKKVELSLQKLNLFLEQEVEERTKALRASEANIRAMVEAIPDLLLRVTQDGECLDFINSDHQDQFIKIHENIAEVLPPELLAKQLTVINQAIATGDLQVYEHQFSKHDHLCFEEVRIVPINLNEVLIIVRDITKQKQVEAALHTSETRFRRVFESNVLAMVFANLSCQVIDANDRFLEMMGYSRAEIETNPINLLELTPPKHLQKSLDAIDHLKVHGKIEPWEKVYYHKDGHPIPVIVGVAKLSEHDYVGVMVDISDRKQTEEKLLALSNRLSLALQAGAIGTWEWDLINEIKKWDERMYEIYDLQHLDRPSTHQDWLARLHPDDLEATNLALQAALKGEKEYSTEFRIVLSDNTIRWIYGTALIQRNEEGKIVRITGINQDITERKQAQQILTETNQRLAFSNQELARATRLKDEFLANMSHELRTPLNAILGITEGLQEEVFGLINPQQQKVLLTIERSGNHLLELINDILDLAKIESGKITLDYASSSVEQLSQSSVMFVKQLAMQKNIQLDIQVLTPLPELTIDERRIRQVLINLLSNAVKFTPEGGKIILEISLKEAIASSENDITHWVRFALIDTGIGIAPDALKTLFQPFIQVDSALNRQYDGTGLGLALVKRIVELHGGHVEATSEIGVGSCFAIELPYNAVASPLPKQSLNISSSSIPFVENTDDTAFPPLILIAEDNQANIITISSYLQAKGYRVILAKNGQEAVDLVQSAHPDLVLMDIQMPEMDGLEAIQYIRNNRFTTPIIALTALAMTGDRERCIEAGANDYLSKPIKLKQLASVIHQFI
ncbi:MAG: hypothetical protein DCF19_16735 [Pseudanabaena frigida]|uniref:Circadian input-output histidine kinase CikA n=1 Tax=Pseudanabaena frigida TaxID=945775 RepID=A0A2W4VZH7_9CYAN|nr:MAG: hypothetical protein DCF19_16735 [Pseudanabaena frigida]